MDKLSRTKAKLREVGLRVTAPRLAVLEVLTGADRPLSHAEVVERLGADAEWDRATVYRNLVALTGVKLLRVASHAGGAIRYELTSDDAQCSHPHFVCDDCGTVSCLPETHITPLATDRWSEALSTALVQFVGRCPDCSEA